MAEDLEAEADQKYHCTLTLGEGLRVQAHRLIETTHAISDIAVRRELATCALTLSIRAEAITNAIEDPEIIEPNIRRYQSRLNAGICDEVEKKSVEEMLVDAKQLLDSVGASVS